MKAGDVICCEKDKIIERMTELAKQGVETDFKYEYKGRFGLWLEVKRVSKKGVIAC